MYSVNVDSGDWVVSAVTEHEDHTQIRVYSRSIINRVVCTGGNTACDVSRERRTPLNSSSLRNAR